MDGRSREGVGKVQTGREQLLRYGLKEEIGLPTADTGHREWL